MMLDVRRSPAVDEPSTGTPSFLMSPPVYYDTHFMFNPWLDYRRSVDRTKAVRQWENLVTVFEELGATIEILEPNPRSPAQVFTADGAARLLGPHFLILRNDGARGMLEPDRFCDWFDRRGYTTEQLPPRYRLDGGNIVTLASNTLALGMKPGAAGAGERYLGQLLRLVAGTEPEIFGLVDRRFLHLDMVLGRVGNNAYLLYEEGFKDPGTVRARLQETQLPVIRVDAADAGSLACNGVTVGGTYVTNAVSRKLRRQIERAGSTVAEVDVGEFLKAGGGVRCLTLGVTRD